ncbi:hypothetical protein [Lentibacillus amyloliquefaciens]|uniref:Uncharacterized protein n=1 Tax=Lentibacillus amyloliquefaciens TaxID=1472767 RepID=A0A0U4EYL9_9BACI|nr:hypothetical protein [Lentibacillus amyloliquefaciens]ALX48407.1 hypothetical protein AOX59_07150 [Lentibacillus amyloliquefaciens]
MNTLKGPFLLMFKEMRLTFYINFGITIALMALYIFLSYSTGENGDLGSIFGPFYAVFLIYPFILFQGYKYILSLGGTRRQFMMATFASVSIYMVLSVLILNGLHLLSQFFIDQGQMFHMADLVNGSHPLLYIWIDLLWVVFLFGVGIMIKTIWFNLGNVRTLICGAILLMVLITTYTFADLSPFIEFVIVDHLLFVHILAGIAVLFMLLSFLIMRNGPLERGDRARFIGKQQPE